MNTTEPFARQLWHTVDELSDTAQMQGLFHQHRHGDPLPSAAVLKEIIGLTRAVLFPGYFGSSSVNAHTVRYHIGVQAERLFSLLAGQIQAGLCFAHAAAEVAEQPACPDEALQNQAEQAALAVIERLPDVRRILATDVEAAYMGDPAAQSYGEVISCYPAIRALSCYRLAHELHLQGVPLIPRIITELAHSETGIDIHPAAQIGNHFTIDHGTGVVIGATCIIGNHVKLYQGVTLGAKNFPLDELGHPMKNHPRHPILEDDVIVYSNATILGRITIGRGATIGANMWVTHDVEAGAVLRN